MLQQRKQNHKSNKIAKINHRDYFYEYIFLKQDILFLQLYCCFSQMISCIISFRTAMNLHVSLFSVIFTCLYVTSMSLFFDQSFGHRFLLLQGELLLNSKSWYNTSIVDHFTLRQPDCNIKFLPCFCNYTEQHSRCYPFNAWCPLKGHYILKQTCRFKRFKRRNLNFKYIIYLYI